MVIGTIPLVIAAATMEGATIIQALLITVGVIAEEVGIGIDIETTHDHHTVVADVVVQDLVHIPLLGVVQEVLTMIIGVDDAEAALILVIITTVGLTDRSVHTISIPRHQIRVTVNLSPWCLFPHLNPLVLLICKWDSFLVSLK